MCVCVDSGWMGRAVIHVMNDHDNDPRTLGAHICLLSVRIGCARKSEVFSMVS